MERTVLYQRPLSDLNDSQIKRAFRIALTEYQPYGGSFPSPGELKAYALRDRLIDDSKEILARGAKPPDWTRLDDIWEDIERRADQQERDDLAYVEPIPDDVIELAMKTGRGYPGSDRWVDWDRRRQARERRAKGIARPPARKHLGAVLEHLVTESREPGEDG